MLYTLKPTNKLLLNRWMTKDGTVLFSRHRHDFVQHFDIVDQAIVYVDGGLDYARTGGDLLNMCCYDNEQDHEEVRNNYMWTSFGANGDEPAKRQAIMHLTSQHIEAILATQVHLPEQVKNMFKRELNFRSKHD